MSVLVSGTTATRTIFRCLLCGGLPQPDPSSSCLATASRKPPAVTGFFTGDDTRCRVPSLYGRRRLVLDVVPHAPRHLLVVEAAHKVQGHVDSSRHACRRNDVAIVDEPRVRIDGRA